MNDRFHFEYVGNLHIHSRYSDGAGSVAEIARSAKGTLLDFIVLNDHDYMTDSLHLDEEGFYQDLLVLMGLEIGGRYHHYLALDLKDKFDAKSYGPQAVIDRVNGQGGFGFLAHPFEKGMPFHEKSVAYTWNDLSVTGYTGISIWNYTSRWKERVKTPLHGLFFLLFKTATLKGPSRKTVTFWDALCQERRVVAIGGSDAHGTLFRWGPLSIRPFTYRYLLNSITVHLLMENPLPKNLLEAKKTIYTNLKDGRLFIVHENLAPGKGFRFHYQSEDGVYLTMGGERVFVPGILFITTPRRAEIRLLQNGSIIGRWRGCKASFPIRERGVYRVEVYFRHFFFGWRPWIFSNPIYLR